MPAPPPVGFVAIRADDPPTTLLCRLGEEAPELSGGIGGWEEVERPRRSTVTTWKGQPARRLVLPILIDGHVAGQSVEGDIARLERLALPRRGDQPPTVRVLAQGAHIPYQKLRWVIDSLSWGDAIMDAAGNRTRQFVTVGFLQFVSDELIEAKKRTAASEKRRAQAQRRKAHKDAARANRRAVAKSRRAARKKKDARAGTASTFDGEDLMAIAARELGDARRWREIADLNGIRDPRAVHVGQVLRLP